MADQVVDSASDDEIYVVGKDLTSGKKEAQSMPPPKKVQKLSAAAPSAAAALPAPVDAGKGLSSGQSDAPSFAAPAEPQQRPKCPFTGGVQPAPSALPEASSGPRIFHSASEKGESLLGHAAPPRSGLKIGRGRPERGAPGQRYRTAQGGGRAAVTPGTLAGATS